MKFTHIEVKHALRHAQSAYIQDGYHTEHENHLIELLTAETFGGFDRANRQTEMRNYLWGTFGSQDMANIIAVKVYDALLSSHTVGTDGLTDGERASYADAYDAGIGNKTLSKFEKEAYRALKKV